ncbi:MAG: ribulose-phosphate 3-epimerase [Candidatus Nanoarchaeia archaeon]
MNQIVASIIATNQRELDERIDKVKDHVDRIQLDVMDGRFVRSHSLDFDFRLPETACKLEAHLMIEDVEGWIEKNAEKVDIILAHIESCDPQKVILLSKQKKKKIGFALRPETSVQSLIPLMKDIDQALILTVQPGFYGSRFIPEMASKIYELRRLEPDLDIEVDGGITPETIRHVADAGANLFVSGSFLQKNDVKEAVGSLKRSM